MHYDRFHPRKPIKHCSIKERSILNLTSTNKRKLVNGYSEKVPTKVPREETNSLTNVHKITNKISADSEDGSVPNNSVNIADEGVEISAHVPEITSENSTVNTAEKEFISVDKDTMNTLLLSIKGKKYSSISPKKTFFIS